MSKSGLLIRVCCGQMAQGVPSCHAQKVWIGPKEVATVAETRGWHPPGVLHHLMTSKAKVEELWPRQQRESRETPIWRAVAHVRLAINDSAHDKCYPATLTALRQAALDGKIRLRGRRELDVRGSQTFSDVSSDIPAEYWRVSVIGPMATSHQGIGYPHTNPETVYAWGPKGVYEKKRYADLTVNMQEIERLWPSR